MHKKENFMGIKVEDDLAQAIIRKCKRDRVSKSALIRSILQKAFESELVHEVEVAK